MIIPLPHGFGHIFGKVRWFGSSFNSVFFSFFLLSAFSRLLGPLFSHLLVSPSLTHLSTYSTLKGVCMQAGLIWFSSWKGVCIATVAATSFGERSILLLLPWLRPLCFSLTLPSSLLFNGVHATGFVGFDLGKRETATTKAVGRPLGKRKSHLFFFLLYLYPL